MNTLKDNIEILKEEWNNYIIILFFKVFKKAIKAVILFYEEMEKIEKYIYGENK